MPEVLSLVQKVAVWALPTLLAFTGHAIVMAQLAWRFGDHSAELRERLSWNPFKHVDPVGTVAVPLVLLLIGGFVIGWPKVVPLNAAAFRQPRKDLALVSLGAVGGNLAMAVAWALLLKFTAAPNAEGVAMGVQLMAQAGVIINLIFTLFGLLPIPGFAGGHVVAAVLPPHLAYRWYRAQQWTLVVLIVLMVTGALGKVLMPPFLFMQAMLFRLVGLA